MQVNLNYVTMVRLSLWFGFAGFVGQKVYGWTTFTVSSLSSSSSSSSSSSWLNSRQDATRFKHHFGLGLHPTAAGDGSTESPHISSTVETSSFASSSSLIRVENVKFVSSSLMHLPNLSSLPLDEEQEPPPWHLLTDHHNHTTIHHLNSSSSYQLIQNLVSQRLAARQRRDYITADALLEQIQTLHSDNAKVCVPGCKIRIRDLSQNLGGGTWWTVVPMQPLLDSNIHHFHPRDENENENEHNREEEGRGKHKEGEEVTVLQLAHAALGLASSYAENNALENGTPTGTTMLWKMEKEQEKEMMHLLQRIQEQLIRHKGTDLRGRSSTDALFWLSLSGILSLSSNNHTHQNLIYTICKNLLQIATQEIQRFAVRPSCKPKFITHMVQRVAASGYVGKEGGEVEEFYRVAEGCLRRKQQQLDGGVGGGVCKGVDLHQEGSLMVLWKWSTKQRKQRAFLYAAREHYQRRVAGSGPPTNGARDERNEPRDEEEQEEEQEEAPWYSVFSDPSQPLVVDVGCGMGVSLLGLSSLSSTNSQSQPSATPTSPLDGMDWNQCNYAGVDLSRLAVHYANGVVASRQYQYQHDNDNMKKRAHFFACPAEEFLQAVKRDYPGEVVLIMVQFPTPFQWNHAQTKEQKGNTQLPQNPKQGFMVSQALLQTACTILQKKRYLNTDPSAGDALNEDNHQKEQISGAAASSPSLSRGYLLLQSNCEDVAVYMRHLATTMNHGFACVPTLHTNTVMNVEEELGSRVPQRTAAWLNMQQQQGGGGVVRAEGDGWSKVSFLPKRAETETEVACRWNGTPVHRCLLTPQEE